MTDYATLRTTMVDTQIRPSDVTKYPILDAMLSVPREAYVPQGQKAAAYVGENVALDARRVVLEPRSLAKMLDFVDIQNDEMVLDIGAGLGYSSAVIAHVAELVVAVEDDEARASEAQTILSDQDADNVIVHNGNLNEGAPEHGPYDVIVIQGAVEKMPETLLDQLKEGGRIVCIFAEGALGVARVGYKNDDEVSWRFAFNASAPVLPGFEHTPEFVL